MILSILIAAVISAAFAAIIRKGFVDRQKRFDAKDFYIPIGPTPEPGCRHGELVEVDEKLTGEIVAYICGRCGDQLLVDDPAAIRFRKDKEILKGWNEITDTIDAAGNQTVSQAERFALRVKAAERLQMMWDRVPGWIEGDTELAQEILKPQIQAVLKGFDKRLSG